MRQLWTSGSNRTDSWFSLAFAVIVQRTRSRTPASTTTLLIRHLGGFGLFSAAILDSSPLPTFGGLDILAAILAARHVHTWYYYAAVSTAGSLIGASITFRIGKRAGADYVNRKFGEARVQRLLTYYERWGWSALLTSTLVPLPFPTSLFFLVAGTLNYPFKQFMGIVALGRSARYALICVIASAYGRRFIRLLRHPIRYMGWSPLILAALIAVAVLVAWLWRSRYTGLGESNLRETPEQMGATADQGAFADESK